MRFSELAKYFDRLEKTSSRLKMTEILAELFGQASGEEIDKICYLSLGKLVPLYQRLEFNLAEKMVMRAVAEAFGTEVSLVRGEFKRAGDLGEVVNKFKIQNPKSKITKELTVLEVYKDLRRIAEDSGQGSQERKVKDLARLLRELDDLSAKYVARMVVGKLRLGFSDKTMIDALSWMKKKDKSLREEIEKAYFVRADIGALAKIIKNLKSKIQSDLRQITPELGVPIMPALCQRLKTADEMITKMGKVAAEPKFDGTRVQIHFSRKNGEKLGVGSQKSGKYFVRAFTRNMDEVTHMFPELEKIGGQIKAKNVILDSEAVGMDPQTKRLLTFQQTIVRKRKHGVEKASREVPLKFFVFDVLYKDGKGLLTVPLAKRREILEQLMEGKGSLELTEQIKPQNAGELREYHSKQLKKGLEGAVVKKLDDIYVPGRRGWSWVKFKEEEKAAGGLADTLDCVVMGYYRGKGKRASFGIGAFLVGVTKGEKYVTVAKIGTGLTDRQWKEMKVKSEKQKVEKKPKEYVVNKNLEPDVWVEPKIVVEIAADNVTKSPIHSAGWALRFPRLVRFRDDKQASQATSVKELKLIK